MSNTTTSKSTDFPHKGLDSLSEYIKQETSEHQARTIPPLEKWHPEHCGEMNLVIKANGDWWHEGSKIQRQSLVNLFSSVLWMEGEGENPEYYLKTPIEKIRITVEDVPFLITDVNIIAQLDDHKDKNNEDRSNQSNISSNLTDNGHIIEFMTSTGDIIQLNDTHPLQMRQYNHEDRPYIPVRFGMLGLLSRQVFMHLIKLGELIERDGLTILSLQSGGHTYELSVPS